MLKLKNNEVFGISAELAFCELYKCINYPNKTRGNEIIIQSLKKQIQNKFNFNNLEYVGYKNKYTDFIDNNLKISLKTNINKSDKICPQEIGQCTKNTFLTKIYNKIIDNKTITLLNHNNIKDFILTYPKELLYFYLQKLFCCDLIIYIKYTKKEYHIQTFAKTLNFKNILTIFDSEKLTFSKTIDTWNESTTLYISKISIGEFQIHKKRNCIKFRFNMTHLIPFLVSHNLIISNIIQ